MIIQGITKLTRFLFWQGLVRLVVNVLLGMNVRHYENLPKNGPAVIVANHNSHLDTLVIMSLYRYRLQRMVRPIAAEDHFFSNPFSSWFAKHVIGAIPIKRIKEEGKDPFEGCMKALEAGQIVILYPEGTRGNPEEMLEFKKGISYLMEKLPHVPVIPIYMHGLGKALPKGDWVLVPFFCDVFIGMPIYFSSNRETFMMILNQSMDKLRNEKIFADQQ